MLGVLLTLGPDARRSQLTVDQWTAAGTAGLRILRNASKGLRGKLKEIRDSHPIEEKLHRAHYRVFFEWLRYRDDDSDFDIFRNIVRDFIFKNFPIQQGSIVFGKPCPEQRLHSLTTAHKLFGIPNNRLGRKLATMGIAKLEAGGKFYTFIRYILTEVLNDIRSEVVSLIGAKEAAKSIGIKYVLFERLAEQGLVKRYYEDGQVTSYYHRRDIEEFMGNLTRLARRPAVGLECVQIGVAARLRGVMIAPLTDLILKRKINLYTDEIHPKSFREFRVCLKDLTHLSGRQREKIVSSLEVANILRVSRQTVYWLREEGYLTLATERKGKWVRRGHYSTRASLEEFRADNVSLDELADLSGRPADAELEYQTGLGAIPLLTGDRCSTIFRRCDVTKLSLLLDLSLIHI